MGWINTKGPLDWAHILHLLSAKKFPNLLSWFGLRSSRFSKLFNAKRDEHEATEMPVSSIFSYWKRHRICVWSTSLAQWPGHHRGTPGSAYSEEWETPQRRGGWVAKPAATDQHSPRGTEPLSRYTAGHPGVHVAWFAGRPVARRAQRECPEGVRGGTVRVGSWNCDPVNHRWAWSREIDYRYACWEAEATDREREKRWRPTMRLRWVLGILFLIEFLFCGVYDWYPLEWPEAWISFFFF